MANDSSNCGCSNGRTYLIDPNQIFGHDRDSNVFIPQEDLNIYVELTTSRKSRSIISVSDTTVVGVTQEGSRKISFIDGSNVGGKKSLTTKYTELTTVLQSEDGGARDNENLGITSIDIDFNSSYAPIVKIDFVDLRGASLFNTGNPPNSDYATFFDLPYPIFELTIKGYYGKPVKYCLHLTKWNAKFNSESGNFEITADFIGYTYAMLTDMLLGYLRAITKTKLGAEKFEKAKSEMKNPEELITINELLNKISDLNNGVEKLKSGDTDVKDLASNKDLQNALKNIESLIDKTIDDITKANESAPAGYLELPAGDGLFAIKSDTSTGTTTTTTTTQNDTTVNNYKGSMSNLVIKANDFLQEKDQLKLEEFTDVKVAKRKRGKIIFDLNPTGDESIRMSQYNFKSELGLKNDEDWESFRERAIRLEKSGSFLDFYDFSKIRSKLIKLKDDTKRTEGAVKDSVGRKLQDQVIDILGFEPSVRNIFRIFTIHAEIFLECLTDVSVKAEKDELKLRKAQLNAITSDLDIHKSNATNTSALPSKIFPWPLYREKTKLATKNGVYEEAWIGKANGVTIPQNIPEVVFVEDLLKGLLEVNREDQARLAAAEDNGIISDSWYPINPLDTPLFGATQNPYKSKGGVTGDITPIEPLKLMMMRAFTFLGVSNRAPTDNEIETMGALEANTCFGGIINQSIKDNLVSSIGSDAEAATLIINTFLNGTDAKGDKLNLNGVATPFMKEETIGNTANTVYNYTFISDTKTLVIPPATTGTTFGLKFLPITGDFTGKEFYDSSGNFLGFTNSNQIKKNIKNSATSQPLVFVSGISPKNASVSNATFMRIISESEYDGVDILRPNYSRATEIFQRYTDGLQESGASRYLDVGNLYKVKRELENDVSGWKIFGDDTSKFAHTTIKVLNYSTASESHERAIYSSDGNGLAKALFYINQDSKFGSTSLCSDEVNGNLKKNEFPLSATETINGDTYYPTEFGGRTRKFSQDTTVRRHKDLGKTRNLFLKAEQGSQDVMVNSIDFGADGHILSLFGSELYFQQRQSSSPKASRGLLFLYTLPWNQMFTDDSDAGDDGFGGGLFDNAEGDTLSNLFGRRAAFINTPRLWTAWLGGIIWRMDTNDIISDPDTSNVKDISGLVPNYLGGSGSFDPLIFGESVTPTSSSSDFSRVFINTQDFQQNLLRIQWPARNEYLTSRTADAALNFSSGNAAIQRVSPGDIYKKVDLLIRRLPKQIKDEFKKSFFEFINGEEWELLRKSYEIHDKAWDTPPSGLPTYNVNGSNTGQWNSSGGGTNSIWYNSWATIADTSIAPNANNVIFGSSRGVNGVTKIKESWVKYFRNWEQAESFGPIRVFSANVTQSIIDIRYNYDITYRGDTEPNRLLTKLITDGVWIANASYKPWVDIAAPSYGFNNTIATTTDSLKLYVQSFVKEFRTLNKVDVPSEKTDEEKQSLFNTMDDDAIRLNIYRHCKAVYDKWIAGSGGNIVSACGAPPTKDKVTASISRNTTTPRLIDSFRFVNRAFNDLGDDFIINPKLIADVITDNPNQSFYNLISRVLADNNFNFIALPAYIDFDNPKDMCNLFKAEIFNDTLDNATSGPTFVCVYVGQGSKNLDLGDGSDFPNDGFDFTCDEGQLATGDNGMPLDFTKQKEDHEHNVVAFAVNYGHQNQNIFTDIKLDQQEFSETDESLQITDSIANGGAQSNRTLAGQNLWNVYQVRSYSSEITSLGNAMIQPMMYYQLNNIPMFHGAYQIIHAKHKIEPNHMKTTFKGVRTRYVDTPQIEGNTLYMSLLGTLSDVETGAVSSLDAANYNATTGLPSDVLPTDPSIVNELGLGSVFPNGIIFNITSLPGPRAGGGGASKNHGGLDVQPKDKLTGKILSPAKDTSVVWNSGFDYSTVGLSKKNRPEVNVPVLAGADGEVFALSIRPSVGIIVELLVDKETDGKGYVMRYLHLLDVSDKIVEAAGLKAGFTLNDWKANNVSTFIASNLGIKVKKGEILGLTGGKRNLRKFGTNDSAGPYSDGEHLHLELLEFDGINLDKTKIRSCGACHKGNYDSKGLTAKTKDYSSFLANPEEQNFKKKQGKQDDQNEQNTT